MKCAYHPEREPSGACVSCGNLICAECEVQIGEKKYCKQCVSKFELAQQPVSPTNVTQSTPSGIKTTKSNPNWFIRHINWTLTILFAVAVFLQIILSVNDIITNQQWNSSNPKTAAFIVVLGASIWFLSVRKLSKWILIPVFIGSMFIVPVISGLLSNLLGAFGHLITLGFLLYFSENKN